MFAADTELDILARCPAPFGGQLDQLAHAFLIKTHKRILRIDALIDILREELC